MENTKEILRYAMDMEKRAQEFYDYYKDRVKNQKIRDIFVGLSAMEVDHYEILKEQLEHYSAHGAIKPFEFQEQGETILSKNEKDLEVLDLDEELSDLPVLRMAYSMENDFAIFYEKAMERTSDAQAKKLLSILAKWEREHRDAFQKEVKQAMESSWFGQGFYPF